MHYLKVVGARPEVLLPFEVGKFTLGMHHCDLFCSFELVPSIPRSVMSFRGSIFTFCIISGLCGSFALMGCGSGVQIVTGIGANTGSGTTQSSTGSGATQSSTGSGTTSSSTSSGTASSSSSSGTASSSSGTGTSPNSSDGGTTSNSGGSGSSGTGTSSSGSSGGGTSSSGSGSGTQANTSMILSGVVQGGQQPISGAQITMYAAGTSGYGTGATPLLSGAITSAADGTFNVTGSYTCPTASTQVYVVAAGGSAGGATNNAAVLIAALGDCSALTSSTYVHINEVTSVATVYALSQFMKPGSTAIGTSSTNVTGMVNGFMTVANLVNNANGAALATTPAGNGTAPQSTVNTLAGIMEACVNPSTAANSCGLLFAAAKPNGGVAPTDTLSAMLDIALNPGRNVATLYQLLPTKAAFQPSLTGAPNDWTLSISYTGGGLDAGQLPAVDAAGNIWVPNATDPGTLSEFSPTGAELSPTTGYTGGGLSYPEAVAVDLAGNVWSANEGGSSVSEFTSNGSALSGTTGFTITGMHFPYAIAVDGTGNVFSANGNNTVSKFNSAGAGTALFKGGGLDVPYAVAIDASENVWIANGDGQPQANSISKFSNSGKAAAVQAFTGAGLSVPYSVAIDANGSVWAGNTYFPLVSELNSIGTPLSGAGYATPAWVSAVAIDGSNTVWTANGDGSVSRLANNGAAISPAMGYISNQATGEVGIAIDATGNVWTTDANLNAVFEYVGAASPVVVPQALAVKNNALGQRP